MDTQRSLWLGVLFWGVVLLAGFLLFKAAFGNRVVAKAVAPDGTKMYLVQRRHLMSVFAGKGARFNTILYVKRPDGTWRGFYGVWEDGRWNRSDCDVRMNQERVIFHKKYVPEITYFWASEKYILHPNPNYTNGAFNVDGVPLREW